MPVIPTYDAQASLDPDTRGMPHVRFDESQFQAQANIGRALEGLGSDVSAVAQRAEQKQQEAANFATGLQGRALQQDLQGAYEKNLQTMPANGTGFTKSFAEQADAVAKQRFDQMPLGPARDRAIEEWHTVQKGAWLNRANEQEYKQQGVYSNQQINQSLDGDMASVQQNPADVDGLFDRARSQIENAPGLTTAQKVAALADYQRTLYGTELQTRFSNDPEAMREALHMATPGTPGATFSRMLGVENAPGDPGAVSPKGALGLAQVMPDTAREVAAQIGRPDIAHMGDEQMRSYFAQHPDANRQIGREYFSQLLRRYDGNQEAAVIAYNAGPARANAWLQKGDDVLPAETVAYRDKVLGPDGAAAHSVTTHSSPLGSVGFDGSAAIINGKRFSAPSPAVSVAKQFAGMDEKANRDTLSAFIEKACGQQVDPSHIPWCASFADAVLGASGKQTLGSARAADFLNYGAPTRTPSQGDIVVFSPQAAGRSGHVGFVVGIEGDRVRYIAGNDGNKVKENTQPLSAVMGFRVPPPAQNAGPDGGVFNGKYAALTFNDRQKLIAGAEAGQRQTIADGQRQAKLDTYAVKGLVDDDVQSLASTGQGVSSLDSNRVAATLGPEGLQRWQEQRAVALGTYKASAGMESLSNNELEAHAEQFRPGPQDAGEGFGQKQAVYQAVHDRAERVLKLRSEDPAEAVAAAPDVVQAQKRLDTVASTGGDKVAAMETLVQTRLAAQDAVGIPDYVQSPIPAAQAKLYATQLRPLSRGQAEASDQQQFVETFTKALDDRYGRYGHEVLKQVLRQVTLKKDSADILAGAIERMRSTDSGPLVTTDEGRRLQGDQQADVLARQSGAVPPSTTAQAAAGIAAPSGSIMRSYDPRETYSDGAFEGATSDSLTPPTSTAGRKGSFLDAVDTLQRDPSLLPAFVKRYGADRVPASLRQRAGAAR